MLRRVQSGIVLEWAETRLRQKLKEGLEAAHIEMPNPAVDVRLREPQAA